MINFQNFLVIRIWLLGIIWNLVFGVWNLKMGVGLKSLFGTF
jgi:hypothetical protein